MKSDKKINIIYIAKSYPNYGANVNSGGARLIHGLIINNCLRIEPKKYRPIVLVTDKIDNSEQKQETFIRSGLTENDIVKYLISNNHEEKLLYFIDSLIILNNPQIFKKIIKFWKGKLIYRPQELDKIYSLKKVYGKKLKFYLSNFSVLISQSDEISKALSDIGINKQIIRRINNGVDLEVFYPDGKEKNNSNKLMYVYSGRLFQPKKKVVDLINAWKLSKLSDSSNKLFLVGPFDQGIPEVKDVDTLNDCGIELLGPLKQEELAKLLQKTNVFILPSIPEGEGFSNSLLEAGACGNLLIARKGISGASSLIVDNKTGFFFENIESLAEILIKVQNNKIRELVSKRSTKLIHSDFSVEKMAREHLELYKELVG